MVNNAKEIDLYSMMLYKMSNNKSNSLYDRVNKLLVSYEWSDCSFSVSGKKFKAHKLILGISSPVFEAMFYGPMASNDDICITDTEPEIFQLLLNYIYTDKIKISSIEEAFELMYLARKYLLEHLTEICISYIQANITVDNVITILNYPDYMQDNNLVSASLKLLSEHANYVLLANLNNISLSCMQKILQCGSMNISEKNLIKCVFKWTEYQCKQSNIEADFTKRRDILINHELFKQLRFAVLSLEDLNEIVNNKDNMLLPSESEKIRQYMKDLNSAKRLNINFFDTTIMPRNEMKLQWKLCHRSPLRSVSPATIDNQNNSIHTRVKANKSVFINSISIPSRMATVINYYSNTLNVYCEQFTVSITGECDNSINKDISIKKVIDYDSNLDVVFMQPLFIKKDQWYKISFEWPRQTTYYSYSYAVQSRECSYKNSKIEFQFEDSADCGGSFLKGLTFCL